MQLSRSAQLKKAAAEQAVEFVRSGMTVGLGTGSTAVWALRKIGQLLESGQLSKIWGIPTSAATKAAALSAGIPLTDLETAERIDVTIDGADEVDPDMNLIKGGGGALLREKIVAEASQQVIIVVDESKLSDVLGTRWALPVEILPFGWGTQKRFLKSLGATVERRLDSQGQLFKTDGGNFILDANFGPIRKPTKLAQQLSLRSGILEHGLFLGLASRIVVASPGGVQVRG